MSTVSIITPFYNGSIDHLRRAVESVARQTVDRAMIEELIIIDDGSSDEHSWIPDQIRDEYSTSLPIKVLHRRHEGVSAARNAALDILRGDFIAFLDSDDALEEKFLESALSHLAKSQADYIIGGISYEHADGTSHFIGNREVGSAGRLFGIQGVRALQGCVLSDRESMRQIGLQPAGYGSDCGVLFRRSLLGNTRFRQGIKISEDRLFNYDFLSNCRSIEVVGESWYRYIQNRKSTSQRLRVDAKEELLSTAEAMRDLDDFGDRQLAQSITRGIVSCFRLTLNYTIVRKGFRRAMGISRIRFVSELMDEEIYSEAFGRFLPKTLPQRILRHCVVHHAARALVAMMYGSIGYTRMATAFRR